jgi:biotin-(acetyl-CoA carboxylase) ligase
VLEGRAVGLAEDGALLVREDGGRLHRFNAGDVQHLRRAPELGSGTEETREPV